MYNTNFMNVLDSIDKLAKKPTGLGLGQSLLTDYIIEQLSILHVLHDQE